MKLHCFIEGSRQMKRQLVHQDDRSRTKYFHGSPELSFLLCYCTGTQFSMLLTCFNLTALMRSGFITKNHDFKFE